MDQAARAPESSNDFKFAVIPTLPRYAYSFFYLLIYAGHSIASCGREISDDPISKVLSLEFMRVDALIVMVPPHKPPNTYSLRNKKKM
jgi:hypothetical protein